MWCARRMDFVRTKFRPYVMPAHRLSRNRNTTKKWKRKSSKHTNHPISTANRHILTNVRMVLCAAEQWRTGRQFVRSFGCVHRVCFCTRYDRRHEIAVKYLKRNNNGPKIRKPIDLRRHNTNSNTHTAEKERKKSIETFFFYNPFS